MIEELKMIAEQLGTTVEFIWPIFVRAQYTEALYALLINVFVIMAMLVTWRATRRWRIEDFDDADECIQFLSIIILIAATMIEAILFIYLIVQAADVFNPEYAALQELRQFIPGK